MKLLSVETLTSPSLTQVGVYETNSGRQISVYFRTDASVSASPRTDHFFLVGALAAFLRSEPYQHQGLVDEGLYENFHAAMRLWARWWRHRPINISAETVPLKRANSEQGMTASLLSGGVDSLFTVQSKGANIDTLINVVHSKDPGTDLGAQHLYQHLSAYADACGKSLIGVETNVMTAFREIDDSWAPLSHGACLAAIGHFLSGELNQLIVSASFSEGQLRPWGSHPELDPLMSSSDMVFHHEGVDFERFEKHQAIAEDPIALRYLSVCEHGPQTGEFVNCSNCQKCLRSMISLDLLGVAPEQASGFDWSDYAPTKLKRYLLPGHVNTTELLDYADKVGRDDIANVLRDVIDYADKYRWIVQLELFARRRFKWILKFKGPLIKARSLVYGLMNIRTRRL